VTGTFRPGRRLACLVLLAALPLTACAAGYQAETSRERTTLTSVGGAVGDLTLRNIFFYGPADSGQALPLYLSIFNAAVVNDKLVGVSSVSAAASSVPGNNTVPGGGSLAYNKGTLSVPRLLRMKRNVLVGQTVTVTLTFARAGSLTLQVPVEGPTPTIAPSSSSSSP
jgi:copper(I)-binding protein